MKIAILGTGVVGNAITSKLVELSLQIKVTADKSAASGLEYRFRPASPLRSAAEVYSHVRTYNPKKQMTTRKAIHLRGLNARTQTAWCLVVFIALGFLCPSGLPAELKADAGPQNKLVGTWKLVSAKYGGQEFKFEEGVTTLKHVTTTQFMWASYDKDGKVTRAAGGRYTLKNDTYEETPEYGLSSDFDEIKGKAQTFRWHVEGNKWHHNGKLSNGLTIEEIWVRLEEK